MPAEPASVKINTHKHQFDLRTDGKLSFVTYEETTDDTLTLLHTEVDPDLEGQGIGTALVRGTLDYIRANDLYMIPSCPFVKRFVERHPEYQDLVSPDSRG
jgi:uncharacterized protein